MNAVCMETPAVNSSDFVGALAQHQSADGITIERKKTKPCECAPLRRFRNLRKDRFIDCDTVGPLLSGDASDSLAELINAPVEFALEGVRGSWIFSDWRQRTERNTGRGLGLQSCCGTVRMSFADSFPITVITSHPRFRNRAALAIS